MAQFAAESFTGTAGVNLNTLSGWTRHAAGSGSPGDLVISSANRCRSEGVGLYYHSGAPASADYSVSLDVVIIANGGGLTIARAAVRIDTSADTYYFADIFANGNANQAVMRLYKNVAGVPTALVANSSAFAANVNDVFTLKIECAGTTLNAYKNGSLVLTATDSSISAAGKAGILGYDVSPGNSSGFHIDNFSADDPAGTTRKWRIPTTAADGNARRIRIFNGANNTIDDSSASVLASGGYYKFNCTDQATAVALQKFATLDNWNGAVAVNSIFGSMGIATVIEE